MPSGTWEKIETKTLTSAGSLNFTAIPATFTDIFITGQLRANGGSFVENAWFYYNGDTGTNYGDMRAIAYGGSNYTNDQGTYNQGGLGAISGSTATSGLYTSISMMIHNYASTSMYRPIQMSQIAYNYEAAYRTGNWLNLAAAINRIEFNCAGGSGFAPGTTVSLWGIKEAV
jgi:hypothetical protein